MSCSPSYFEEIDERVAKLRENFYELVLLVHDGLR